MLPDRPVVVEDAGGPLGRVAGDAVQAAGLLARGVCSHEGLALLLPALTQELSHLAGHCVVFLPDAFSFSLPPGFYAPQGGLAAFDGLPAPGHLGLAPDQRFPRAFLPVWYRQALRPRQVVQPGFALVGVPFPLVGQGVTLIGTAFPLVSDPLALVSEGVTLVGTAFPLVSGLFAPVGVPSELACQSVMFPSGAFSFSLPPGFVAPLGGLAAYDGLPAPGNPGLRPGQRLPDARLPVWHRQAMRPRQGVQPGFALVSVPFPQVSDLLPVVSDLLPVVSDLLALVSAPLAPVGPPVLRRTGTAPRVMLGKLHPFRMHLSQ